MKQLFYVNIINPLSLAYLKYIIILLYLNITYDTLQEILYN